MDWVFLLAGLFVFMSWGYLHGTIDYLNMH